VIEGYVTLLSASLRVRGRARKRFLAECRDHLRDLVDDVGAEAAVIAFGKPEVVAALFDAEVATSRSVRSVWSAAVGVIAVGCSTLALISSADTTAQPTLPWSIAFFAFAQVSAVAMAIALIHAIRIRHSASSPADAALLCRRTTLALIAAALTMFAAGGALAGQGDARLLLAGPAIAIAAGVVVAHASRHIRRLEGSRARTDRSPFIDLSALTKRPISTLRPTTVAAAAGLAAVARDRGELGSTLRGSLFLGVTEAGLVLIAYIVLRAPLGLRALRTEVGAD
jgi:hypothetical protein